MSNLNINLMKKMLLLFGIVIMSIRANAYELLLQDVRNYIKELNILHPDIVIKQAVQESGWYESHESIRCNTKNNLFGFKRNHEYVSYENWNASVLAYSVWQNKNYTGGDYYEFLIRIGYASDPEYISKLKSIRVNM